MTSEYKEIIAAAGVSVGVILGWLLPILSKRAVNDRKQTILEERTVRLMQDLCVITETFYTAENLDKAALPPRSTFPLSLKNELRDLRRDAISIDGEIAAALVWIDQVTNNLDESVNGMFEFLDEAQALGRYPSGDSAGSATVLTCAKQTRRYAYALWFTVRSRSNMWQLMNFLRSDYKALKSAYLELKKNHTHVVNHIE